MAIEINAGDNFSNLDLFPSEPTGQTEDLITGKMFNQYFQEVNFHGSKKEALEFLSDISYEFPEENDLKINFDKSTGIEEVQINYEKADFKVKNLELKEADELISSVLPEIYTAEVSDGKRSISSFYEGAYHIDTKENAVRKEDVEFLLNSVKDIEVDEDLESYAIQSYEMTDAFNTKQRVEFVPNADDESIVVKFSSDDGNGIETSFKEQIENIVKTFPIEYTVETNEPYLGENRYEVSNYIRETENGDLEIIGIPKGLGKNVEADRIFSEMKKVLQKHYNDGKEIFATYPEFGLKVLEGPQNEMESFDNQNETQYAFSGTVKYDDYGFKEIKKLDSENTFMESSSVSLEVLWKNFQKYREQTTDTLEFSGRDSAYSISDCMIDGLESFNIIYSKQIANYDVLDFSRENSLKLLVVDDSDFSPYGFRNNETWASIENGNIKIAISKENFNEWIETEGGRKEAIEYLKESTGLKETEKRFKNIEIQIYNNEEYWNDNFFKEKGIAEKIILKQEKNRKIESKNKKETKTR